MALPLLADNTKQAEREAMYEKYLDFMSYVKGGTVMPRWMADGNSFWYAEGAPHNTVIYKVNPVANAKEPLFETNRLRKALTPLLGHEPAYSGLPFENFTFVEDEKAVQFTVEGKAFICQLDSYTITKAPENPLIVGQKSWMRPKLIQRDPNPPMMEIPSPDGRWFASDNKYNVWLRSSYDGRMLQLTEDGVKDNEWFASMPPMFMPAMNAKWSPDGLKIAVYKVDNRKVEKFPMIHWLKPVEEIEWEYGYVAGGPIPQAEVYVIDIISKTQTRIAMGDEPDKLFSVIGWRSDGSELLFTKNDRDYKKVELMAADPVTGTTRVILSEERETFIIGAPYMAAWANMFTPLPDNKRFLWISERDGWAHLYLYDLDGKLIRQLTKGTFPVVRVVLVDEEEGWIYFTAHGEKRIYDTHLYRVNFQGQGFQKLTEAPGQHDITSLFGAGAQIQFSPSKKFFLDSYSSTDNPPTVELRTAEGILLQELTKANIDQLKDINWSPPEEFVVKAQDEKTDIYGVLFKPNDFDASKKYPIIDSIYAGPQTTYVPRTFIDRVALQAHALAQMGFIVVVVDARGTPERDKAFQDVVYGNFGRNEIPDHVAAITQLAKEHAFMDLERVGVYGLSWGGYFTLRAMLTAPDFYHVGVSLSPIPDPSHAGFLHEIYLGLPEYNNAAFEYASNTNIGHKLEGKLLIIHGTNDSGCRTALQMRMAESIIRAGKFFDLIILPGRGHGLTYAETIPGSNMMDMLKEMMYSWEATKRYFIEHLKPDNN